MHGSNNGGRVGSYINKVTCAGKKRSKKYEEERKKENEDPLRRFLFLAAGVGEGECRMYDKGSTALCTCS